MLTHITESAILLDLTSCPTTAAITSSRKTTGFPLLANNKFSFSFHSRIAKLKKISHAPGNKCNLPEDTDYAPSPPSPGSGFRFLIRATSLAPGRLPAGKQKRMSLWAQFISNPNSLRIVWPVQFPANSIYHL